MKKVLHLCILFFILFHANHLFGQVVKNGYVVDQITKEPLAFAYVYSNASSCGTITNDDGYFEIDCPKGDSIIVSFLGYKTKILPLSSFSNDDIIHLVQDEIFLNDITITANNDFLYELLSKARKELKRNDQERSSKSFLHVFTSSNERPLENSESFYNVHYRNSGVENLVFKNGRSILARNEHDGFFVNLDISQALSKYSLIQPSSKFPKNPLQLSKRKLKKNYHLSVDYKSGSTIKISFQPKRKNADFFSGSLVLNTTNNKLIEIEIHHADNSQDLFKGIGSTIIDSIEYSLKYAYLNTESDYFLNNIQLNYQAVISNSNYDGYPIVAKSILHLYDQSNLFVEPKFEYNAQLSDYRLFTIPPDTLIWSELNQQNKIKLTSDQVLKRHEIVRLGFDFNTIFNDENPFFESNYAHWSGEERQVIKNSNSKTTGENISNISNAPKSSFLIDQLQVETQLYFDVIESKGDYVIETAAILDIYESFNHLEVTNELLCFVNIYFDIAEIYRRKLVNRIDSRKYSLLEMEKIYHSTLSEMKSIQQKLNKEAFVGMNIENLKKWNAYVNKHLGIDNMKLFHLQEEMK